MTIQIKISDNEGIMLRCTTTTLKKPEAITTFQRDLHVYIKENHLFIVDNNWNALHSKTYSYAQEKCGLDKLRKKTIAKKPREIDGICIDLSKIKLSKNIHGNKPRSIKASQMPKTENPLD